MVVKKAQPLPVECVIRGYLAGSGWKGIPKGFADDLRDQAAGRLAPGGAAAGGDFTRQSTTGRKRARYEHSLGTDCKRIVGDDVSNT